MSKVFVECPRCKEKDFRVDATENARMLEPEHCCSCDVTADDLTPAEVEAVQNAAFANYEGEDYEVDEDA